MAQDTSRQVFHPVMVGNSQCFGHVQCDSIIMGQAHIESIPAITANCPDAQLIHEAAIGKIAGDQLLKLETLGLSRRKRRDHPQGLSGVNESYIFAAILPFVITPHKMSPPAGAGGAFSFTGQIP